MEINKIIHGDCFEVLKSYPDNFFDSVVTDPPYGISFMGRKWDYQIPSVELWQEVIRVLKPGGHALVACGTRTQHRMAVNLEDAGFEIRDIVSYVYGSGFPKNHNVGKAIDKLESNEREMANNPYLGKNPNGRNLGNKLYGIDKRTDSTTVVTKGNSEWEGWGTALKPAVEFFTLCRKPLSEKTVAENVLKWGTGAINIDDCRIACEGKPVFKNGINRERNRTSYDTGGSHRTGEISTQGRFPANFIHDGSDEVVDMFPETKSSGGSFNKDDYEEKGIATNFKRGNYVGRNDSGSASRFFYCAKASPSKRNMGCENKHPTVKPIKLMSYLVRLITPPNGIVLDPFGGSGTTAIACLEENKNYVLIERESEYIEIANARINAVNKDNQLQIDLSA